jgi:hypothetical protein
MPDKPVCAKHPGGRFVLHEDGVVLRTDLLVHTEVLLVDTGTRRVEHAFARMHESFLLVNDQVLRVRHDVFVVHLRDCRVDNGVPGMHASARRGLHGNARVHENIRACASKTAVSMIGPAACGLFSIVPTIFSWPNRFSRVGNTSHRLAYALASLARRRAFFSLNPGLSLACKDKI